MMQKDTEKTQSITPGSSFDTPTQGGSSFQSTEKTQSATQGMPYHPPAQENPSFNQPPYNGQSYQDSYTAGQNIYNGGYGSGYEEVPRSKDNSNKVIAAIIIVTLVIILGLGGAVAFFLLNNNKKPAPSPITTTAAATTNASAATSEPKEVAAVVNVEHMKEADACLKLNDAGIKYQLSRQYSDTVESGYVISQNPTGGYIGKDEKVTLYISKGPEKKEQQSSKKDESSEQPKVIVVPGNNAGDSANNYYGDASYIIPDSDSRQLSESEVRAMDRNTMNLAINEIYARKGRRFKSSDLQSYFNSKSWYHGTVDPGTFDANVNSYLNSTEVYNVKLIDRVQRSLGYK